MHVYTASDYRGNLYRDYASAFQDAEERIDRTALSQWGKAFDYYLRGWLPDNTNSAIVDLACGGGNLLYFFQQRGYAQLSGVDISPSQVRLARQVVPDVREASALDFLEEYTATFDLITAFDLLEHLQKNEVLRFLHGAARALRPGGRLILQTPNAESPWGGSVRYADLTHEVCFTPEVLKRLLRLHDFTAVQARELGPVLWGHSWRSCVRSCLWQGIRLGLMLWNVVETGSPGSGIFTRVFIISALKGETACRGPRELCLGNKKRLC